MQNSRRNFLKKSAISAVAMGAITTTTAKAVPKKAGQKSFDTIIIGGGHNALSAAMVLSDSKQNVLLLEKENELGGCAKTAEITEKGFFHDLFATNIGLFLGSQIYKKYGKELHKNGFEILNSTMPYASVFPDNSGIGVYMDAKKTMQSFERVSKKDALAWQELVEYFKKVAPLFFPLLQEVMPSFGSARQIFSLVRKLEFEGSFELAQLLLQSSREFSEYWFENEKVQSLFMPWGFHLDYAPDIAGGATFAFAESVNDFLNGMAISKGGIINLINSMKKFVTDRNAKILTNSQVVKILIKNNKAMGVRLENGDEYFAENILANVTPTQLVNTLLQKDELPEKFIQKAQKYSYGPATMMIYLALNEPLEWLAGAEYKDFSYVHIGPYAKEMSETYTDALNHILPASPLLVIGQQSAIDKTRAPQNSYTLWIQVRAVPFEIKGDRLDEISSNSWDDIKETYANRIIKKISQYAPNVYNATISRAVFSPVDLMKNNINLVNGDSVSGSHHISQNYMFRPFPGASKYETPIKNLYICGSTTWPGGGLNATSGYLAAEKILDS